MGVVFTREDAALPPIVSVSASCASHLNDTIQAGLSASGVHVKLVILCRDAAISPGVLLDGLSLDAFIGGLKELRGRIP